MDAAIQVVGIQKKYHDYLALNDFTLAVPRGKTLALTGPSGCGKTTLLRLLAGLERPTGGEIFLQGNLVSSTRVMVPSYQRNIGLVFQDLALWPHMTVSQHLDFVMGRKIPSSKERRERITALLDQVRLPKPKSYPYMLSGGERQRLALARALAQEPATLLLDEPFSSMDQALKEDLLAELKVLLAQFSRTTLYVTHSMAEAEYIAESTITLH